MTQLFRFTFTRKEAAAFYAEHLERPYFSDLVTALTKGPCIVIRLEGPDAINKTRVINGDKDNPSPGSIRGDYFSSGGPFNLVHAPSNKIEAQTQIGLIDKYIMVANM